MVFLLRVFTLIWCDNAGGIFGGAYVVCKNVNLMKAEKFKRIWKDSQGWLLLHIKQRLYWFLKSAIATTRPISTFHLKTCWCSHRVIVAIIVTQNLLGWNQAGHWKVWYDVVFVFKTSKKRSQNVKKEQRVWMRKLFEKCLFLCVFLDFCQTGKEIS